MPVLSIEDIRILVEAIALTAGVSVQNATDAAAIIDDYEPGIIDENSIKEVRAVLERSRCDIVAARALSDKLGLVFNCASDETEPVR